MVTICQDIRGHGKSLQGTTGGANISSVTSFSSSWHIRKDFWRLWRVVNRQICHFERDGIQKSFKDAVTRKESKNFKVGCGGPVCPTIKVDGRMTVCLTIVELRPMNESRQVTKLVTKESFFHRTAVRVVSTRSGGILPDEGISGEVQRGRGTSTTLCRLRWQSRCLEERPCLETRTHENAGLVSNAAVTGRNGSSCLLAVI